MAKAIKQIELVHPSAQEEQAQDIAALLEQLAENREAIYSAIDIISQLQKVWGYSISSRAFCIRRKKWLPLLLSR
jgi:hypothetical protein